MLLERIAVLLKRITPLLICVLISSLIVGLLGFLYSEATVEGIVLIHKITGFMQATPLGEKGLGLELPPARYTLLILPSLGGLLVGILHSIYGSKPADYAEIFWGWDKTLKNRDRLNPIWRLFTSAITITSGGSGGKVGPMAAAGSALAGAIASAAKIPKHKQPLLLICGAGAGIATVIRAPLSSALYAAEVLYYDIYLKTDALVYALISSLIGWFVIRLLMGPETLLGDYSYVFVNDQTLSVAPILGLLCALFAFLYARSLELARNIYKRFSSRESISWIPIFSGAIACGALILFMPQLSGTGYGVLQSALDGGLCFWFMIALAVGKILATSATVGLGGSGGLFAPALAIGGLLGGFLAGLLNSLGLHVQPEALILIGMGAFLASATKTPFASVILVIEMGQNPSLMLPAAFAVAAGYMASRGITIFPSQRNGLPISGDTSIGNNP
ncbi:MAG: chloride channel protein [candidate division WOR-3 bacterium]